MTWIDCFNKEKIKFMLFQNHFHPKPRLQRKWERYATRSLLLLSCGEIARVIILFLFFFAKLTSALPHHQPIRAQGQRNLPLPYHFPEILYIRTQKSDFPLRAVWTETWTPHPRLFENAPIIQRRPKTTDTQACSHIHTRTCTHGQKKSAAL